MAVIKFTNSKSSIKNILEYITQESKTETRLISGKDCMPETALAEMELIKDIYRKKNGRQYIHIVQSFDPKEILTHEQANKIGVELAERFTGFQAVIATHKDRNHIHNHILLNSVNFETGYKFQQSQKEMQLVKDFSDELCLKNGLSIIEKSKNKADINKNEYQVAVKGESWKMKLINSIDSCIEQSESKQGFIDKMNKLGYSVNWSDNRKFITYTTSEGQKCRDKRLHDEKYLKDNMEIAFNKPVTTNSKKDTFENEKNIEEKIKVLSPKINLENVNNYSKNSVQNALVSAIEIFGATDNRPKSRIRKSELSKQAKKGY